MNDLQRRVVKNLAGIMASKSPKISVGKLSIETDIDKSYLAKVLRGERRMNLDQLSSIAKVLKVDPSILLKP
jgi:hypothetical protein